MRVTYEKLAELTGFTTSYIGMQLNGRRKVTEALKKALRELAKDEPGRLRKRADRIEQLIAGV